MKICDLIKKNGEWDKAKVLNSIIDRVGFLCNGEYEVVISKKKVGRSIPQNDLMWEWFTRIAKGWAEAGLYGYTKDHVKEYYTRKFIPITLPNGETIGGSTKNMSQDEMSEFLENVRADAASEFGIYLPTADELKHGIL